MFIGLLMLLADLAVVGGLGAAVITAAMRMRRARLDADRTRHLGRAVSLSAMSVLLVLLVLGNVRFLTWAYEKGRPASGQVTGIWADSEGATLRILPGGTFTASGLPAEASGQATVGRSRVAGGAGRWRITRGDGVWYALFTLRGGPQFRLDSSAFGSPRRPQDLFFSYTQPGVVSSWVFYRR